jgi:hypothetical protein
MNAGVSSLQTPLPIADASQLEGVVASEGNVITVVRSEYSGWDAARFEAAVGVPSSGTLGSLDVTTDPQYVHRPLDSQEPSYLTKLMDVMGDLETSKTESLKAVREINENLADTSGIEKSSAERMSEVAKTSMHSTEAMMIMAQSSYISNSVTAGIAVVKDIVKGR